MSDSQFKYFLEVYLDDYCRSRYSMICSFSLFKKFPKMWIKASMGQGLYVFCVLNFKYALYALMAWHAAPGLKAFLAGAFCWASQGPGYRWFGVVNYRESIDLRYLQDMLEQERLKLDFDVTLYNCLFEVMMSIECVEWVFNKAQKDDSLQYCLVLHWLAFGQFSWGQFGHRSWDIR